MYTSPPCLLSLLPLCLFSFSLFLSSPYSPALIISLLISPPHLSQPSFPSLLLFTSVPFFTRYLLFITLSVLSPHSFFPSLSLSLCIPFSLFLLLLPIYLSFCLLILLLSLSFLPTYSPVLLMPSSRVLWRLCASSVS